MSSLFKLTLRSAIRLPYLQSEQNLVANIWTQRAGVARSLFTGPILNHPTTKRRKTHPFFWLQDQYKKYYEENLTEENEQFYQKFLKEKYTLNGTSSPLKTEPWNVSEKYTEDSRRCGLLCTKIGKMPIWLKDGTRCYTTVLMVGDNHVIRYKSPDEFTKSARPIDASRFAGNGCLVVGSNSSDPRRFTAEYNGLFTESGVMPKKKLTRFFVTHNARIEPGTPLFASHFRPGMYVDIYGKTKALGPVSLRRRFKLKLGKETHGATKSHNRIGSIGRGRKHAGPLKGKRMPGWHGNERRIIPGVKILRINTKYNLIYVKANGVQGDIGNYVNLMDTTIKAKKLTPDQEVPFPTVSQEENSKLPEELYDSSVHIMSDPSIIFEITEEDRKLAALAAKKKATAKTAQKIR